MSHYFLIFAFFSIFICTDVLADTNDFEFIHSRDAQGKRYRVNAHDQQWLTASVSQLQHCWTPPHDILEKKDLTVELQVTRKPDKSVDTIKVLDTKRYHSDPLFKLAADSAEEAILNPRCNPLELPDDKYDVWKSITIRFDPRDMF